MFEQVSAVVKCGIRLGPQAHRTWMSRLQFKAPASCDGRCASSIYSGALKATTMPRYRTVSAFEWQFVHCHVRWRAEGALAFERAIFEGPLCECLPSRTNEAIESLRAVNELLLHTHTHTGF